MTNLYHASKDSDIAREIRRMVNDYGWVFTPGSKHGKLVSKTGYLISVPCTPGGPTALRQLRSKIRRGEEQDNVRCGMENDSGDA